MSKYQELVIDEILQVTPNAILISYEEEEYWIPKSQIEDNKEPFHTATQIGNMPLDAWGEQTIYCTSWILEQKGIIY